MWKAFEKCHKLNRWGHWLLLGPNPQPYHSLLINLFLLRSTKTDVFKSNRDQYDIIAPFLLFVISQDHLENWDHFPDLPKREGYVCFIMGIMSWDDTSVWDSYWIHWKLCPVTHFTRWANSHRPLGKMKRRLPRISPPQSQPLPPPSVLSGSRYSTHLPDLAPRSSVPQPAPQPRSPPTAFSSTSFPPLTNTNSFYYPTLNISLASSSSVHSRPSLWPPVHRGPLSCYSSIAAPTPPPSPSF